MSFHSRSRQSRPSALAEEGASLRETWVNGWNFRWLLGLLALSLLLGPTLGQMHRAVHLGSASSSAVATAHSHQAPSAAVRGEAVDCAAHVSACSSDLAWVHALFAGHGPAECQLLDQANLGYAGPPSVLAFTAPAPSSLMAAPLAPAPRAIFVAAPLTARAPPLHLALA